MIVLLIGYGVIYSKVGKKVGQLKQITNLSVLSLIITGYLLNEVKSI
jgi:hypothetical protein